MGRRLIIGGDPVPTTSLRFTASLRSYGHHFCGAVLVADGWALTAAHCIDKTAHEDRYTLVVHPVSRGCTLLVLSWTLHPMFDAETLEGDLAVLHLGPTTDCAKVPKPRLDDGNALPEAAFSALAVGWGTTAYTPNAPVGTHPFSQSLRSAILPLHSDAECQHALGAGATYYFPRVMLCAGWLEDGGPDTCEGDSGGPLFAQQLGGGVDQIHPWTLIGITSWGYGCGLHLPGVYTRLAAYSEWLLSILPIDAKLPWHPPAPLLPPPPTPSRQRALPLPSPPLPPPPLLALSPPSRRLPLLPPPQLPVVPLSSPPLTLMPPPMLPVIPPSQRSRSRLPTTPPPPLPLVPTSSLRAHQPPPPANVLQLEAYARWSNSNSSSNSSLPSREISLGIPLLAVGCSFAVLAATWTLWRVLRGCWHLSVTIAGTFGRKSKYMSPMSSRGRHRHVGGRRRARAGALARACNRTHVLSPAVGARAVGRVKVSDGDEELHGNGDDDEEEDEEDNDNEESGVAVRMTVRLAL